MDDFITVHDLLDKLLGFSHVHLPDLTDASVVCFFEPFKLALEVLESIGKRLVVLSELDIDLLELLLLDLVVGLYISDCLHDSTSLSFKLRLGGLVDSLTLSQHTEVEFQLFIVQFEDGFHVLHALLQCLHLLLKLNLLVSLVISVTRS